jgi:hypothetical protein
MKYLSPLKYLTEVVLRAEFEDSDHGMFAVAYYSYTEGITNCHRIIAGMLIGCILVSYLMYSFKVRKNT